MGDAIARTTSLPKRPGTPETPTSTVGFAARTTSRSDDPAPRPQRLAGHALAVQRALEEARDLQTLRAAVADTKRTQLAQFFAHHRDA